MPLPTKEPKDRKKGAFYLNVFLPGAGFLYLRRWKLAALNLAAALAAGVVIGLLTGGRDLGPFNLAPALTIGLLSGYWAESVAEQMQEALDKPATLEEIGDQSAL